MAFHDILRALDAETDARISASRKAKNEAVARTRERLESATVEKLSAMATDVEHKKKDMERQVVARADMNGRRAAMTAKHALMERAYGKALETLAALDPARTEKFLKSMIDACPDGGTIRPAQPHEAIVKKLAGGRHVGSPVKSVGGFVHESELSDRDCTYETLVRDILRPATELRVASILFPARDA